MKFQMSRIITIMIVLFAQGCSTTLSIRTPTSTINEVVACIADNKSHGKCDNKALLAPLKEHKSATDYLTTLSTLDAPAQMSNSSIVDALQGTHKGNETLREYSSKFTSMNCERTFNIATFSHAKATLTSDQNIRLHELLEKQLNAARSAEIESKVELNTRQFNEFITALSEAEAHGGLPAIQCNAIHGMFLAQNDLESENLRILTDKIEYIKKYFSAYFRHGHFIQGSLNFTEINRKIAKFINSNFDYLNNEQKVDLLTAIFKKITGLDYEKACNNKDKNCIIDFAGHLEPNQFVTRSGAEYGFPHITASIDPLADKKISITKIDWNKVGAEITKVYIEAIGDATIGLPADPRSTACKEQKALKSACFTEKDGELTSEEFSAVAENSDKVDALVSNAAGKVIRGGWLASLNNEALASIIETAIGTAAKKATEKIGYCTYSCLKKGSVSATQNMEWRETKVKVTY